MIAKNSNEKCGYRKGDIIIIKREAIFSGDFIGENITRPDCYGNPHVYLGDAIKCKIIKDDKEKSFVFGKWLIKIKKLK